MTNSPTDAIMPGVRRFQWENMRWYVRDCADRMNLRNHTIFYATELPEGLHKDVCGAVFRNYTRTSFNIYLPPAWYEMAAEDAPEENRKEARATVAHELIHVHLDGIENHMTSLQTNLGDHVWGVWNATYEGLMEVAVDQMAIPMAEALPLPAIPQRPPRKSPRKKKETQQIPGFRPEWVY